MNKKFAEMGADPKYKSNHPTCKRCGKKHLYAPMPSREDIENWGAYTMTILIIAFLSDKGWKVVKTGDFGGDYICPDCLTDEDTNVYHPTQSAQTALPKYKEWVNEMREKYNYYDD